MVLHLTNDDFTNDLNGNRVFDLNEQRLAQYNVIVGNTFMGGRGPDVVSVTGMQTLVKGNQTNGYFQYLGHFYARCSQRWASASLVYENYGNRVVENHTEDIQDLTIWEGPSGAISCPSSTYLGRIGQYQVRDNVAQGAPRFRSWALEVAPVDGPNVVTGNSQATPTPTPTAPVVSGPSLLRNASFETVSNGFPADWQARSAAFADPAVFRSGGTSLRLEGPASGFAATYSFQRFNLTPGATYTLSIWAKTQNVTGTGVSVRYAQTSPVTTVWQTPRLTGTSDWVPLTVTFTAPANTVTGRVDAMWEFNAGDKAWVDDVRLSCSSCPASSPTATPTATLASTATLLPTTTPTTSGTPGLLPTATPTAPPIGTSTATQTATPTGTPTVTQILRPATSTPAVTATPAATPAVLRSNR
jgi:hypothetical protein